jgi:hypothetical protein
MLCHIQLTVELPQHLRRDGYARTQLERVTHVRNACRMCENMVGQLTDQLEFRDILDAGGCFNIVIQRHNPRPPERS